VVVTRRIIVGRINKTPSPPVLSTQKTSSRASVSVKQLARDAHCRLCTFDVHGRKNGGQSNPTMA
jgi:hypothetical protein